MTHEEYVKDWYNLSVEEVREKLSKALSIHRGYVDESRYASAGYDVGKGYEVEAPTRAYLQALKEIGIESKEDLANVLWKLHINSFTLQLQHEPYVETYDDNGKFISQEKNPWYSKSICGYTFDDTYAFMDWMKDLAGDYPLYWYPN